MRVSIGGQNNTKTEYLHDYMRQKLNLLRQVRLLISQNYGNLDFLRQGRSINGFQKAG